MNEPNLDDQLRGIHASLRSAMNGMLSARMREVGMPYKIVFGVELPRLESIAREFPANRRLAQQLWNENIRESKLLAAMLMPQTEFLPEMADIWVEEMPTAEVAQTCVMYLLAREPWAADVAFQWIASEHPMRQLCGFLIVARLLSQGIQFHERSLLELRDQADALLPHAGLPLRKAIHAVLSKMEDAGS